MKDIEIHVRIFAEAFASDPDGVLSDTHDGWRKILNDLDGYSPAGGLIATAYLGFIGGGMEPEDAVELIVKGVNGLVSNG